ncbi:MAG TPA: hypothetical protein VKD69_26160 [Vicinamibacterales bacterium]|nr:hypothetical protein [Vicinamibacterales bacterium]
MAAIADGSLARHAACAACLFLLASTPALAQPQQLYVPPPAGPEFLPRYDFHMNVESLSPPKDTPAEQADERFSWDTHFGGSFDVLDIVVARAGAVVDYEAVEGSEFRPFDPNQGNYTLEAFVSARVKHSELGAIFHHISRHLSDRPKREAIAWNELGARFLHRFEAPAATVDLDAEGGYAIQHSFVDYTWLGELNVLVRHAISPRVGVFGYGQLRLFGIDTTVVDRGTQTGAKVEAGVRLGGRGGAMELYLGYENRVDAYPLDRVAQHWGLAGLRLVSR